MAVVAQAFDLRQMLVAMSKINWEVKEVMSQHNAYIDVILRVIARDVQKIFVVYSCFLQEIQIFALRLEQISAKVPVTMEVSRALWENIAHIVTHTLVHG